MKKNIFIFLLIPFTLIKLFSQDNTSDIWEKKAKDFRLSAISKDLLYADINQLKSLAQSLGLPEENDASSYRTSIAKYYGVKLLEKKTIDTVNKIILKRAGELKFEKNEKENDEIMHIVGRVRLVMEIKNDENKTVVKTLEANEIFFDTKNKEITGKGDVYFRDDRLEYRGEQLYFNYNINRGILIKGRTKLLKGGDSGLDDAYFSGEKVVQTEKEDIILYNGMLTTDEDENPHYYLKVSRLWVSQKGEWGLLNGAFYVGPVPFFYMPLFYHPKELIINPSFGFREREGWFFNSTYYIFGKKFDDSADTTSTVAPTASDYIKKIRDETPNPDEKFIITKTSINNKLMGFYNKYPFYAKYPQFKIFPSFQSLELGLRVFADAYTNLGFFTGVNFYINALYPNNPFKINVVSDFAFSRKLWKDPSTGNYVTYNPSDQQDFSLDSTFFNLNANSLNYRTSQWVKMNGSFLKNYINFDYAGQLEYASDKMYFTDFYNRKLAFSYLDVLADAISYGMLSSGSNNTSGIQPKEYTEITTTYDSINSYLTTGISLKEYPSIFGLGLLSKLIFNTRTDVVLKDTTINGIIADGSENPKATRYLIDQFNAPNSDNDATKIEIGGTILDYDAILNMPEKFSAYENNQKNKDLSKKKLKEDDLYIYIKGIKSLDSTTDKTEIDYMLLLPIYSKKIPLTKAMERKREYKYNYLLLDNQENLYKMPDNEDKKKEEDLRSKAISNTYYNISKLEAYKDKTQNDIKILGFTVNYNLVEKYGNKFIFDRTTDTSTPFLDTVESLIAGKFYDKSKNMLDMSKILEQFHITNDLNYSLNNSLNLLKFSTNSLFSFNPKLVVTYLKQYDNLTVYDQYLQNQNLTDAQIKLNLTNLSKSDRVGSKFQLKYYDTITNDLSFGLYRFSGTQIQTNIEAELFTFNEDEQNSFINLNQMNSGDPSFERVNSNYYDNRRGYDKIKRFDSSFIFKVNLLEENNPHHLSMSIGPLIRWFIQDSDITNLKSDLWNQAMGSLIFDSDTMLAAQDYIYYRNQGPNLNSKIMDFFSQQNFWAGPKNFRKMFDNVTYTIDYGYIQDMVKVVNITDSFIFKLGNVGAFSNQYTRIDNFTIYPNNDFLITFFNSCISYENSVIFTPQINPFFLNLTPSQNYLDEYNIMTMDNIHTFNFKIPGTLFDYKLPSGDWLTFTLSLDFIWDRRVTWNNNSEYNYFFLKKQDITINLLMDIFKFSLDFQKFNFVDTGYGFELNQGAIEIGHNITEIPTFLRFFKLTLEPRISYAFYVNHDPYYDDSGNLVIFSPNYYTNNILKFSITINLSIAKQTPYETIFSFSFVTQNNRMQDYYGGPVSRNYWGNTIRYGLSAFFQDMSDSFNFSDINARRSSPFDMQSITFSLTHLLSDWVLKFTYEGKPLAVVDPTTNTPTGRFNWENTFTFEISWQLKTKNQLMKMLNKTKIDDIYQSGQWQQPAISLDPNADNSNKVISK